jgi:lipoic acid synthetase
MSSDSPLQKPEWLRVRSGASEEFAHTAAIVKKYGITTICEDALCPNIGECWKHRTVTFMIMGNLCTRNCGFCGIRNGIPDPLNPEEPTNVASAIKELGLKYAVITSAARDDLPDGGASCYANVIYKIREFSPETKVEILTPDFWSKRENIKIITDAKPDVYGHNIEVIRRLYQAVKKPPSDYDVSIECLRLIKEIEPNTITKSGMMVGVGEEFDEVMETFKDLKRANVDIITVGQYISPSASHYPVIRYITPEEFEKYKEEGLKIGFKEIKSGPLIRSSYGAGESYSTLCGITQNQDT